MQIITVIQHVEVIWGKSSRGGTGARHRNALPRQTKLPRVPERHAVILHKVTFNEFSGFKRKESVKKLKSLDELVVPDLCWNLSEEELTVIYRRNPQNAAVANRVGHELAAFVISTNEWGELRYNGRFVDFDTGSWWYEFHVYNIGRFTKLSANCFLKTQPDHKFVEMARLR
jgi:hypothetical protein